MPTGRAAKPSVMISHSDEVTASEGTPTAAKTTAPLSSHLSCCRRSPADRRQVSTWRAMAPTHSTATAPRYTGATAPSQAVLPAGCSTAASWPSGRTLMWWPAMTMTVTISKLSGPRAETTRHVRVNQAHLRDGSRPSGNSMITRAISGTATSSAGVSRSATWPSGRPEWPRS